METKGGEEEKKKKKKEKEGSELLNGGALPAYLIHWFYWIEGEKVRLVCCLPVNPWQEGILSPGWCLLLVNGFQSVIIP